MVAKTSSLAERAIAALRAEREETLRALLPLTDEQCRARVESEGRQKSINQVLRAFTSHELDHVQHLIRLLQNRGWRFTEAELLLLKAHSVMAEFEAVVLSLSDDEFIAEGPNEGDWNAERVVEHVLGNEKRYREEILSGLEAGGGAAGEF